MTPREQRAARDSALAVAAVAAGILGWLGAAAAMVWATLEPTERAQLGAVLGPRAALLVFAGVVLLGALASLVPRAYRRWVDQPAQLLEQARVLADTNTQRTLSGQQAPAMQGLEQVINDLVAQRGRLQADVAQQVQVASQGMAQERNRLAALMSELTQAVVVCNLDGRILLYNSSARLQMSGMAAQPSLAQGAEWIGIGRSIYQVFDRPLLAHALESLQAQMQRGVPHPTAQFLTSLESGQICRVQMAPVREVADGPGGDKAADELPALNGFVLMLANITREFEQESGRDQQLLGFTEGSRASLGNLQAAAEMLAYPDLEPDQRARFEAVVHDEIQAMGRRLQALAHTTAQGLATRWPLEDMLGADCVSAAVRRIEQVSGLRASLATVDASLWLKVDSFSLMQALAYLAGRLHEEYDIRLVQLRLQAADGQGQRAHLDLIWIGQAMSTETVMSWETDAMRIGTETTPLTVREVVQRHAGEFWFERERVRHGAFFRFLLPCAEAAPMVPASRVLHHDSRPEYYDFDLFKATPQMRELDERRLVDLAYTVFDTETTGLEPSKGDEIIQIGATRVVAGKLRRQESFEQLVDPQRDIPAAGIPIHGIEPHMVQGQPKLAQVLPVFQAFARDTVLVAHNAAFDMRFLQLKEAATGIRFDQPVLDTLLLSAVVHPQQDSHRLEAIAERLGITVLGRHTALGDAMVTAEVFLKLIPLLAAQGIHTLGQAREAAQKTYFARVSY